MLACSASSGSLAHISSVASATHGSSSRCSEALRLKTTAVVSDADLGPALAEVEERVGVDDPDLDPPGASQGLDRSGSGAADVEEALERSDKDRRTQGGQIGGPLEHGHQPSMPAHHGFGTVGR